MSRPRTRASVEACRVLDVNELNRRDHLPTDETFWVQVRVCNADGNWETVRQYIDVERRPCHFGGARPYFRCWCDRRAVKLYRGGGFYRCRQCHRLAYESQREDDLDRAFRSGSKIKQRLGGDPNWLEPFPPKPWGMWWRTYERARYRYVEADDRAEKAARRRFCFR